MLFFRQLDWKEFVNQPHIKKLSINEQMNQYNFHLQQMSNLNKFQPKGRSSNTVSSPSPTPSVTPSVSLSPTPSSTPSVTPSTTPSVTPSTTPSVSVPAATLGPLFDLPLSITVTGNNVEQYRVRFNAYLGSGVSDNYVTAGTLTNTTLSFNAGDYLDLAITRIDDNDGVDTTVDASGLISVSISGTNSGIGYTTGHPLPLTLSPGDDFSSLLGHSWRLYSLGSDASVTVDITEGA